MIASTLSATRTLRYLLLRTWSWVQRHPRRSFLMVLVAWWLTSAVVALPAAYADSTDGATAPPWMPPTNLQDSQGVPLVNYIVLPLDRGDVFTPMKALISGTIIDGIWTLTLASFTWCLWLLSFLLNFTWVEWIAAPINGVATVLQQTLQQIGWPVVALSIAGLVCGLMFMYGKFARGGADAAVSILCFVLATGALANPVATLTGEHGALTWAQSTGANLSVSVLSPDGAVPSGTPSKTEAQNLVSDTLMAGLVDVFVRIPAQEIAFGHALEGECNRTFTEEVKKASLFDTSSTSVRDAVGKCDAAAQEYVTHPNLGQAMTALSVGTGSGALFAIAIAMALVLMIAVIYALFNAVRLMVSVYVAMAPSLGREAMWKSFIGMYVGAVGVGISVVLLAVYLKILSSLMKSLSSEGLPIVAQTGIVNVVVTALVITLFVAWHKSRKAGVKLAEWLSRLGLGAGGSREKKQMGPLTREALRQAGNYAMRRQPATPRAPLAAPTPAQSLDVGRMDVIRPGQRSVTAKPAGQLTASSSSAGGSNGGTGGGTPTGATGGRLLGAASTVGQLALAGATGGMSSVALKTATIAGKRVMQRQISTPTSSPRVLSQKVGHAALPAAPSPAPSPASTGRGIVVDSSGQGRIANVAEKRGGAYQVTRMPRRDVTQSPIRAALELAARKS